MNYSDLSGVTYTFPASSGLYSQTNLIEVSGSPTITNMFYEGILMDDNFTLGSGLTGTIKLEGYSFTEINGILLSSNNVALFTGLTGLTSIDILGKEVITVSGYNLPSYEILSNNIIQFKIPPLYPPPLSADGLLVFVPFNKAGYQTTSQTYGH